MRTAAETLGNKIVARGLLLSDAQCNRTDARYDIRTIVDEIREEKLNAVKLLVAAYL